MVAFLEMAVIETGACIEPFLDPVGQLPLLGVSFHELAEQEVEASGVEARRITRADHAIATAALIKELAERAQGAGPWRLTVPADSSLGHLSPGRSEPPQAGTLAFDVFLDAPVGAGLEELRQRAKPVLVSGPTRLFRRELARLGPAPHHLELPDDARIAAHVEHWMHLLWLGPLLIPALKQRRGTTWRRGQVHRSWVAPGAKIHPTAYVEDSVIEADVQIGAGCSIRQSYLGAGTRLGDFTKVVRSVMGPATHTLADGTFMYVVSLGEGTLTNLLMRDVLIGRRVFLTTGVIFWADDLGREIFVEQRGARIGTGRRVLGGAVGHGSVLGARTIVAPGVALPNRTTVVMRRDEGVTKIEAVSPGTPLCWDDARLVPYTQLRPGHVPDEIAAIHEDSRAPR